MKSFDYFEVGDLVEIVSEGSAFWMDKGVITRAADSWQVVRVSIEGVDYSFFIDEISHEIL